MNIYDFAMQMERDGERYYREMIEKTVNPGLKNILGMLADAEMAHYHLFRSMRENEDVRTAETRILNEVKNIFAVMKEEGASEVGKTQVALYLKAQEIEKKSRDFYLAKAAEVADEGQREVFRRVASEEQKHHHILENIIDFISRPEQWLENAEWYHLDEY